VRVDRGTARPRYGRAEPHSGRDSASLSGPYLLVQLVHLGVSFPSNLSAVTGFTGSCLDVGLRQSGVEVKGWVI
jgi:hypothetical protein